MLFDPFFYDKYFLRRRAIKLQYILFRVLAYGNDSIGAAHEQGHGYAQKGPICQGVMLGVTFEDQVVDRHDRRPRGPWQQMLGGMVDASGPELAFKDWGSQELTGEHAKPPGILAKRQSARGNRQEGGGGLMAAVTVVKEGQVDGIATVMP